MSPDVPTDAEVVVTAADTTICPQLALDVTEQSLTPRKRNAYAKNIDEQRDSVYITWSILKKKVEEVKEPNQPAPSEPRLQEKLLVSAGIIPPSLSEVLLPPAKPEKHVMRISYLLTYSSPWDHT